MSFWSWPESVAGYTVDRAEMCGGGVWGHQRSLPRRDFSFTQILPRVKSGKGDVREKDNSRDHRWFQKGRGAGEETGWAGRRREEVGLGGGTSHSPPGCSNLLHVVKRESPLWVMGSVPSGWGSKDIFQAKPGFHQPRDA